MSNILSVRNIVKAYCQAQNRLEILKDVSLTVGRGKIVSILGPSGVGKSTLLHIMGGLDKPDSGQVFLEDTDLYASRDSKIARIRNERMGFVFQFYHLLPEFNALENVLLPALVGREKRSMGELKEKALALLRMVGLEQRAHHRPNQLSGGEQQRIAIARALMNKPDILFCDEPTGNLDSENGDIIKNILKDLNEKQGQTIVIVSHDETMASLAHHKIFMRDGKLNS